LQLGRYLARFLGHVRRIRRTSGLCSTNLRLRRFAQRSRHDGIPDGKASAAEATELHSSCRRGDYFLCSPERCAPACRKACEATGEILPYTLTEAARATGHNRSAIWKAIKRGALSANRDAASGHWLIEAAELHRVFPAALPHVSKGTPRNGLEARMEPAEIAATETAVLRAQLEAERARAAVLEGVVDDLRRRLDTEAEERRRLTALLTDRSTTPAAPVAPRRWRLPWRRL
jgi:hypothetical protein